jgi:hypothetical protein
MLGNRRRVGIALIAAASVAAVAILALLAWIGGEMHYRNCLSSVEMHYPVAYHEVAAENAYTQAADESLGIGPQSRFIFYRQPDRNKAIAACSRWP